MWRQSVGGHPGSSQRRLAWSAAYTVPPLLDPHDVYAADRAGDLSPVVAADRPLIYVPNSGSDTVTELDPGTFRVVREFSVGALPQHVVSSYDLRTLWVANDAGNSLTPIDPALDTETVQALRRHRDTQVLERDLAGSAYEDGDLVFCDELGRPYRPGWLSERFLAHRSAAGIHAGSMHTLRHTAATLALTADPPVPLHIVASRLGDDPATVLSVYAHLLPRSDEQAAERLAGILDDKAMTNAVV